MPFVVLNALLWTRDTDNRFMHIFSYKERTTLDQLMEQLLLPVKDMSLYVEEGSLDFERAL